MLWNFELLTPSRTASDATWFFSKKPEKPQNDLRPSNVSKMEFCEKLNREGMTSRQWAQTQRMTSFYGWHGQYVDWTSPCGAGGGKWARFSCKSDETFKMCFQKRTFSFLKSFPSVQYSNHSNQCYVSDWLKRCYPTWQWLAFRCCDRKIGLPGSSWRLHPATFNSIRSPSQCLAIL